MYPSDIGYSATSNYWTTATFYRNFDEAIKTSWMYNMADALTKATWLLSPSEDFSYVATVWIIDGEYCTIGYSNAVGVINTVHFRLVYNVRPVLNLKSNIAIKEGTKGTSSNPYIFEI